MKDLNDYLYREDDYAQKDCLLIPVCKSASFEDYWCFGGLTIKLAEDKTYLPAVFKQVLMLEDLGISTVVQSDEKEVIIDTGVNWYNMPLNIDTAVVEGSTHLKVNNALSFIKKANESFTTFYNDDFMHMYEIDRFLILPNAITGEKYGWVFY